MPSQQTDLPFSQACENNKRPILEQLRRWLVPGDRVLEVGSGTGQHAEWFANALADVIWQCSDQPDYLPGLQRRLDLAGLDNLPDALVFRIGEDAWPRIQANVVYSANTLHIMSAECGDRFCKMVAQHLPATGQLIIYGPFRIDGQHTADSNRRFDQQLRASGYGGVRDISEIKQALGPEWLLAERVAMPANNQMLRFVRRPLG